MPAAYPFAVRLLGFSPEDSEEIATVLADAPLPGPGYFVLSEDSLQEPDLVIANGSDLAALTLLPTFKPSDLLPALVLGTASTALPLPHLPVPIDTEDLFAVLAALMDKRVQALALVNAAGIPSLPERRRRPRLDYDLTDPADYLAMRKSPPTGAVLVLDTGPALSEHIVKLMQPRQLQVSWTDKAAEALRRCEETPVSLVLLNTAVPGIDAYQFCADVKASSHGLRIAVVLLVSASFRFDRSQARSAGVRGYLDKPVSDRNLMAVIQKLLSL